MKLQYHWFPLKADDPPKWFLQSPKNRGEGFPFPQVPNQSRKCIARNYQMKVVKSRTSPNTREMSPWTASTCPVTVAVNAQARRIQRKNVRIQILANIQYVQW